MSRVAKVSHASPAQIAAARRNLVAARAAQRGRTRTAAQIAASRRNLAIARSAQAARRSGKGTVKPKAAKAPVPDTWVRSGVRLGEVSLHELPACAAVAAAEHLELHTGIRVPGDSVLELHRAVQPARLGDVLEYLRADGFPGTGVKLARSGRCDPDCGAPGLVYGVHLGDRGYHAVVAYPDAMASWGMLLPRSGTPEEAWWLEWEDE